MLKGFPEQKQTILIRCAFFSELRKIPHKLNHKEYLQKHNPGGKEQNYQ